MQTLIGTASGRQDSEGLYEYLKLYGLEGGDIEVIGDGGTHEFHPNVFGPVYNGAGQIFNPDGSPVMVKPGILHARSGRCDHSDVQEAITLWQESQTLTEYQIWWQNRIGGVA